MMYAGMTFVWQSIVFIYGHTRLFKRACTLHSVANNLAGRWTKGIHSQSLVTMLHQGAIVYITVC
eukprot:scaffold122496_cov19-Prasinocladus_malaysianus.AAC.1